MSNIDSYANWHLDRGVAELQAHAALVRSCDISHEFVAAQIRRYAVCPGGTGRNTHVVHFRMYASIWWRGASFAAGVHSRAVGLC